VNGLHWGPQRGAEVCKCASDENVEDGRRVTEAARPIAEGEEIGL